MGFVPLPYRALAADQQGDEGLEGLVADCSAGEDVRLPTKAWGACWGLPVRFRMNQNSVPSFTRLTISKGVFSVMRRSTPAAAATPSRILSRPAASGWVPT